MRAADRLACILGEEARFFYQAFTGSEVVEVDADATARETDRGFRRSTP
jgi:hypothetical protein